MTDYHKALDTLRDGGVRFIVIGGWLRRSSAKRDS
jgi:hypothetical protein